MKKLIKMSIAHVFIIDIYSYLDNCTVFEHLYIFEICETRWFKISDVVSWAQDEVNSTNKIVRDWRGQFLIKYGCST